MKPRKCRIKPSLNVLAQANLEKRRKRVSPVDVVNELPGPPMMPIPRKGRSKQSSIEDHQPTIATRVNQT